MRVAIMQPYFFPYIGYFQLINAVDKFIVFDAAQYIRHGWVNRNRVLRPQEGWMHIIVPLEKHSRNTLIKDMIISGDKAWKAKIINQLSHYKKIAPYYMNVISFLEECFDADTEKLSLLNAELLRKTCEYLKIDFQYEFFSQMNLGIKEIDDPGSWALEISRKLGATEYVNPSGGQELFNAKKFNEANIKLSFLNAKLTEYDQRRRPFEPGLSIIDMMMFSDKQKIQEDLKDYEVIRN